MKPGKVILVGAGPGDPGLITVKGLRSLQSADVVVHDRLVDARLLAEAGPDAELVDVGKTPRGGGSRQAQINALLVQRAREGKRVVRLKGGDPFVFGRGGEEAEALRAQGVPFEVVPGVTSAIAAPAYAGIPVTHRGVASSFTVVTGSESPDRDMAAVDWSRLASVSDTLVVLMGWDNLTAIVEALVRHGRAPQTPIALVQWGTEPFQQTVEGTLETIVAQATESSIAPPVVAVVGEVATLRKRVRWFDNRPLFGKRMLVTRTRAQAGALSALLAEQGAEPIELPTIEIRPPDDYSAFDSALRCLGSYGWVVFSSVNAVDAVFGRLRALKLDARAFGSAKVAAIGAATSASLERHGVVADLVPKDFVSEALVEGLKAMEIEGQRVLLPRADIAPDSLPNALSELGAEVEQVTAYRTVTPEDSAQRLQEALEAGIDVATFTSSSTVQNLVGLLNGEPEALGDATIACIGPVTAATARGLGLKVGIVAREHTVAGLVDALEAHFAKEGTSHE